MNHEHEQSRTGSLSAGFVHFDDDPVEPAQSSRSAGLRKPEHAVASGLVQRDARGGSEGAAAADKTAGRPASEPQRFAVATSGAASEIPFRAEMERGFGADFSNVLAHVGGAQAEIGLRGLGADGAAQGSTVVFASSSPSRELVAHELAHVVQNRNGGVAENAEAAADDAAATVASGGRATVDGGPGFAIQRHGDHATSLARVSDFIAQAVEAGDNARLERIAIALYNADRSFASDDAAASSSSTSEVTVRIEGEDLCLAREDLPTVLHELDAAHQHMAPVVPRAPPPRSEASLRSEAPLRSEVPSRSEAPTPAPPTPAPMSGQPAPAQATGEPAWDAPTVQWMIDEAVRLGDLQALEIILNALRASDAATALSGVTDRVPVTIRGTSYNLRPEDVLSLIQEAESGARTLPGASRMPLGSLADHLPGNLDLQSASATFTLPDGLELSSNMRRTLRTRGMTTATLTVMPTGISITLEPQVEIDAMFPARNMLLSEINYDFRSRATSVALTDSGRGVTNSQAEARAGIAALVRSVLHGTRAGAAGYDPLHDPDLVGTASAIADNFRRMPAESGTTSDASLASMQDVATSVTLAARSQIEVHAGSAVVRIQAGSQITVEAQGAGSAADIAPGGSPQAMADEARFESLTVRSSGIVIELRGEPAVRVNRVVIDRGGAVHVTGLELMGTVEAYADGEAIILLLIGAAEIASAGVSDPAATGLAIERGDARAVWVPDLTRLMLERGISEALQDALDGYPVIGGVDLRQALGITPSP